MVAMADRNTEGVLAKVLFAGIASFPLICTMGLKPLPTHIFCILGLDNIYDDIGFCFRLKSEYLRNVSFNI
jgi:hypothetical protein